MRLSVPAVDFEFAFSRNQNAELHHFIKREGMEGGGGAHLPPMQPAKKSITAQHRVTCLRLNDSPLYAKHVDLVSFPHPLNRFA